MKNDAVMCQAVLSPRGVVKQAKIDGYNVSEYAVRQWIRTGALPVRKVGNAYKVYYPAFVRCLECADSCDNPAL